MSCMKTLARFTAIASIAMLGTSVANARCASAPQIKQAFEPSVGYQASRFGRNSAEIVTKFGNIDSRGLGCVELYSQYKSYLDSVTRKNNGVTLGFRKW